MICLCLFSIFICMNISDISYAREAYQRDQAVEWLEQKVSEPDGCDVGGLANLTADTMAVLTLEGKEADSTYLEKWKTDKESWNYDETAHYTWGAGEKTQIWENVWIEQNKDGGFGLRKGFVSDTYDTLLILEAEAALETQNMQEQNIGETRAYVQKAAEYLMAQQNEDGGIGYNKSDISRSGITADAGIALLSLGIENSVFFEKLDKYCINEFKIHSLEENFTEQAKIARYLYKRKKIKNTEEIEEIIKTLPSDNGSINDSVEATIQYVLLLREIEEYNRLCVSIEEMLTEADNYVLEADEEQLINVTTSIDYFTNKEAEGILRYTLMEDGVIVDEMDQTCVFIPEQNKQEINTMINIMAGNGKQYDLHVQLVISDETQETVLKEETIDFRVHKKVNKDFILNADTIQGEKYGINLTWNNLSDEDDRYNYCLYRRTEDGEWTTHSTWDGIKNVKVLNIYPAPAVKNLLSVWMEQEIKNEKESAGKGLFEIEAVSMDEYNNDPEKYLLDEDGNYKYDVLMFGAYDRNANKDLNEISYEATKNFADAGRGILFCHDTIARNKVVYHPYFARFADDVGVNLLNEGSVVLSDKVRCVANGFLTGYPWKLTGTLTIPASHALGQYTGGTLPSTVWFEFNGKYRMDEITHTYNNAYLFTHNALAMMHIGHNNGRTSDTEKKILANTLFYLKQLSDATNAEDKYFYDNEKPEIAEIKEGDADNQFILHAKDYGTKYQYYVKAINADRAKENKQTNVLEQEAVSGVKGYIIGVSDSMEKMTDLLNYDEEGNLISDMVMPDGETCTYTVENTCQKERLYIHAYAVDHAGNVSEEAVREITYKENDEDYFDNDYALFALDGNVELSCCDADITKNVYANESFIFQGSTLLLNGEAAAHGMVSLQGGRMEYSDKKEKIDAVALPDYIDQIKTDMKQSELLEEIAFYNSSEVTNPVICEGTTGMWCNDIKIEAGLVSNGTIKLNANTVSCGTQQKTVLCSEQGDICIQATQFEGNGLIYAPNGTVVINVNELNYTGTIIAKNIKLQMTYCNINRQQDKK